MPFGLSPLLAGLLVSLALNGFMFNRWMAARDDVVTVEAARDQAAAAGKECSDGVDAVKREADKRAKAAEKGRQVAETAARAAQTRAQRLLAKAPSVPGNTCASAQAQVDDWLSTRRAK